MLLALAPLAACSLLVPVPPERVMEVLDRLPDAVPRAPRRAGVLVVLVSQAAGPEPTSIAYRTRDAPLAHFAWHQWAEPPGRMLQPLVIATLQRTEAFGAVVGPPYFGHAPATLRIELDELIADFSAPPPSVRLSLRALLRDAAGRLSTRAIAARATIADADPAGVVEAANEAVARALLALAAFVVG
jgi:cholesterol transport system auxiliary component